MIQLYYLIQVGFDNENQTLVVLSSILSIWNIVTKMISEDKPYFKPAYQSLELKFEWKPFYINLNWLYIWRVLFRSGDFIIRLSLILSTWLAFGGLVVFTYLGFELFLLFIIGVKTKQFSTHF